MSRKNGHRDRGPPDTDYVTVNADEVLVCPELVVVDQGLVIAGPDTVVINLDEVLIAPEIVLVKCAPRSSKRSVSKGVSPRPR